MYRVFIVRNGRRLYSAPCPSPEIADSFLSAVLDMPGCEGGAVEEYTGCGWCVWIPETDRELLEMC